MAELTSAQRYVKRGRIDARPRATPTADDWEAANGGGLTPQYAPPGLTAYDKMQADLKAGRGQVQDLNRAPVASGMGRQVVMPTGELATRPALTPSPVFGQSKAAAALDEQQARAINQQGADYTEARGKYDADKKNTNDLRSAANGLILQPGQKSRDDRGNVQYSNGASIADAGNGSRTLSSPYGAGNVVQVSPQDAADRAAGLTHGHIWDEKGAVDVAGMMANKGTGTTTPYKGGSPDGSHMPAGALQSQASQFTAAKPAVVPPSYASAAPASPAPVAGPPAPVQKFADGRVFDPNASLDARMNVFTKNPTSPEAPLPATSGATVTMPLVKPDGAQTIPADATAKGSLALDSTGGLKPLGAPAGTASGAAGIDVGTARKPDVDVPDMVPGPAQPPSLGDVFPSTVGKTPLEAAGNAVIAPYKAAGNVLHSAVSGIANGIANAGQGAWDWMNKPIQ